MIILAVSYGFGLVAIGIYAVRHFYRTLVGNSDWLAKAAYFGLVIPFVILLLIFLFLCANKLMISIHWDWFMSSNW